MVVSWNQCFINKLIFDIFSGAFLIPYAVFAVVIGVPLVFLETALGQYFQLSPLLIYQMCPLFKGDNIHPYY